MTLLFYMDHNVPRSIVNGLRARGIDVLTAYEDGAHEMEDTALLDRANVLERVLFTRDDDFLVEAERRQRLGISFYGVIYAHQLRVSIGKCVEDLEIVANVGEVSDLLNSVRYLPL